MEALALGIVLFLLIGILAGWIAGKLIRGGGFGLIGNMVVGVVGAVLGGYVLGAVGIDLGGFFGQLVTAVLGALILLFGVGLVKRA
jgi:uncharacterized membrane protein YeaQ/YmgE (transglycosylase-associated protein family)